MSYVCIHIHSVHPLFTDVWSLTKCPSPHRIYCCHLPSDRTWSRGEVWMNVYCVVTNTITVALSLRNIGIDGFLSTNNSMLSSHTVAQDRCRQCCLLLKIEIHIQVWLWPSKLDHDYFPTISMEKYNGVCTGKQHILLNQLFDTHHITGTQGITRRMILNLNR